MAVDPVRDGEILRLFETLWVVLGIHLKNIDDRSGCWPFLKSLFLPPSGLKRGAIFQSDPQKVLLPHLGSL